MTATTRLASLLAVAAATAAAGPVHAQELTVPIGHTGPLSGANAFAGKDNENGMRLAIEDLNARQLKAGGRTLKFVLRSEDDQCDAKTGVAVAQKFVDDNVKFVVGPYCSGVAIPASRLYSNGGTLMSTVGTNPKITDSGYSNVFRIIASDAQIGASMANYAAKELKVKNVGNFPIERAKVCISAKGLAGRPCVKVVDLGIGPIGALGHLFMPARGFVFVLNTFGLPGVALSLGRSRRRGVRRRVGGESFAQNVAHLVGPAAIVLHDFVDNFRHLRGPR